MICVSTLNTYYVSIKQIKINILVEKYLNEEMYVLYLNECTPNNAY